MNRVYLYGAMQASAPQAVTPQRPAPQVNLSPWRGGEIFIAGLKKVGKYAKVAISAERSQEVAFYQQLD